VLRNSGLGVKRRLLRLSDAGGFIVFVSLRREFLSFRVEVFIWGYESYFLHIELCKYVFASEITQVGHKSHAKTMLLNLEVPVFFL
jgi:hypothetical protein